MATAYVDLVTIHDPTTGNVAPAAWGDQIREDFEALIDPPFVAAFNSAAVSVANNSLTVLNADSESFDNDGMHSTVSNTSRLTVQKAGRYEFTCRVNFQADVVDNTRRVIQIRKNGAGGITVNSSRVVNDGNSQTISGFLKDTMVATDYMEVLCLQNSGGALNVTLQEFTAEFITR